MAHDRAWLPKAPVVVLDETTARLESETEAAVRRALEIALAHSFDRSDAGDRVSPDDRVCRCPVS